MAEEIVNIRDLARDLAGVYKSTAGTEDWGVPPDVVDADLAALDRDGFVVMHGLMDKSDVDAFSKALDPHFAKTGRNEFEGLQTQRVYAVVNKTELGDVFIAHPRIMAVLERILLANFLLSQAQGISILPDEEAQPVHYDTAFVPMPRPRPPLGAATIWALTDFSVQNGGTIVYPGSHKWGDRMPDEGDAQLSVEMAAGGCVLFLGNLWHSGGANRTDQPRRAFTAQYCEPWLRTQENYFLALSRDALRNRSEAMKRMLGYSVHPPFIGMANGMHPKRHI